MARERRPLQQAARRDWQPPRQEQKTYCRPEADSRRLWEGEQRRLAAQRVAEDQLEGWSVDAKTGSIRGLTRIAGVDLSFFPDARHAVACVVVLSFPDLEVIDSRVGTTEVTTPYVPGYLAFREVPPLAEILRQLSGSSNAPQALFVDGNGAYHPRGCGLGTHLGIIAGIPTVGIAKDVMQVGNLGKKRAEQLMSEMQPGDMVNFCEEGHSPVAVIYRPEKGKRPLVVSPGHRISLQTAASLAKAVCRSSVAEPIRHADLLSRRAVRDWLQGVHLPPASPLGELSPKRRRRGHTSSMACEERQREHGGDAHAAWAMQQLLRQHAGMPATDSRRSKQGKRQLLWVPKGPEASQTSAAGGGQQEGSADQQQHQQQQLQQQQQQQEDSSSLRQPAAVPPVEPEADEGSTTAPGSDPPCFCEFGPAASQSDEEELRILHGECRWWSGGLLLAGVALVGFLRWRSRPL